MIPSTGSGPARRTGQIDRRLLAGIVVLVLLAAGIVIYLLSDKTETVQVPEPVTDITPTRVLEKVEPAKTEEERGDTAREIIAELRKNPSEIDYEQAYERALEFQAAGNFADAQLLNFFAARGGYGPAAFELASLQDPNHFSAGAGLMDKPDPFQAYKWYRVARDSGNQMAAERLAELRAWAEAAAGDDPDAERLLLQWE
jgi:TPR repeat protein